MDFNKKPPKGFLSPTGLPVSDRNQSQIQRANQDWWESNPMRYDWEDKVEGKEFSEIFYQEIDERFIAASHSYLHRMNEPFDQVIPFSELKGKRVLEIGVGMGTHAQRIAQVAGEYFGIDISKYAIESTQKRFQLFNINGKIIHMDAEKLEFPDEYFDFVWSWGVVHHSANTAKIVSEIHRVLKKRGKARIMVYYRNSLSYYILIPLVDGLLKGLFLKYRSLHALMQARTDGAIARFYSVKEWGELVTPWFTVESVEILKSLPQTMLPPKNRFKRLINLFVPANLRRFICAYLALIFLFSVLEKKEKGKKDLCAE